MPPDGEGPLPKHRPAAASSPGAFFELGGILRCLETFRLPNPCWEGNRSQLLVPLVLLHRWVVAAYSRGKVHLGPRAQTPRED